MKFLFSIAGMVLVFSLPLSAQTGLWTLVDGQKVHGSLQYCDPEKIVLKRASGQDSVTVPADQLRPEELSRALVQYYAPLSRQALRQLRELDAKSTKTIYLSQEHLEPLRALGIYLREISKPIGARFIAEGQWMKEDDAWTRVHSGMAYFAQSWMEELIRPGGALKFSENKRPKLADVLRHMQTFYDFFETIQKGENYCAQRLGTQFPVKFKPLDYANTLQPYHYWVYLPKNYDGQTPLTLVLFLGGRGEFGTNLDALLETALPKLLLQRQDYPFIVISPQDNEPIARPPYYQEVLADALRRFKVDEDKIILTGISSGGAGCWRLALEQPERFAAMAPVAAVAPFCQITKLRELPVWIFNNEPDKIWIQDLIIAAMSPINPNFKHTYYKDGTGHDAWTRAYSSTELERWFAAQTRKTPENPPEDFFASMDFSRGLTRPEIKTVKNDNYLLLSFDPNIYKGKFANVTGAHSQRHGSNHDAILWEAASSIYDYQHHTLGQSCTQPLIRFINAKEPGTHRYGFPITNVQRVRVAPPFSLESKSAHKCLWAYYQSHDPNPSAALEKMRRLAREAGHTLTGEDRIVYRQFLVTQINFYELQIGIK